LNNLSLYLCFIKLQIKSAAQYRFAFFWQVLSVVSGYSAEFILIWVLINQFKNINSWGPFEVMFLYALNLLSYAFAGVFFLIPSTNLSTRIQSGEFDEVLIKPLNPFIYSIYRDFDYGYIGHIALSITVMVICIIKLGIVLTVAKFVFLMAVILGGMAIQSSAFIFTSVPVFWLIQSDSLMHVFLWDLKSFIRYPISIYNKAVQIFLTLIIPYAFINFYPAQYFLGKNDFLMFHPIFQFLTLPIGIIMFYFAYRFWNYGVKRYKSTGS
jgi:ABC-2 type transport system permease protein